MADMDSRDRETLDNLTMRYGVIRVLEALGGIAGPNYQDIFTEAANKSLERSKQTEPQGVVNPQS